MLVTSVRTLGSMTVLVTAVPIIGTKQGVFAVAMMASETVKCHAYVGFVYLYGKDDLQHKFQVALRKVSRPNCKSQQQCFIVICAAHVRQHVKPNESMACSLENT